MGVLIAERTSTLKSQNASQRISQWNYHIMAAGTGDEFPMWCEWSYEVYGFSMQIHLHLMLMDNTCFHHWITKASAPFNIDKRVEARMLPFFLLLNIIQSHRSSPSGEPQKNATQNMTMNPCFIFHSSDSVNGQIKPVWAVSFREPHRDE